MSGRMTAKVKLGSKVQVAENLVALSFYPDYYGDKAEVNKDWAAASPSLSFQMNVRPDVADRLEVNTSYTVTFEPDVEVKDGNSSS